MYGLCKRREEVYKIKRDFLCTSRSLDQILCDFMVRRMTPTTFLWEAFMISNQTSKVAPPRQTKLTMATYNHLQKEKISLICLCPALVCSPLFRFLHKVPSALQVRQTGLYSRASHWIVISTC